MNNVTMRNNDLFVKPNVNIVPGVNQKKHTKKVFIGTPAYEGKVHVQYSIALVDTCKLLEEMGYEPIIRIPTSGSLLVADRNRLIQMFWESEAEYMLCLDSDLGWNPYGVQRLIEADKYISGGVYPTRQGNGFNFRPELEPNGKIVMCPETMLLKMNYIPSGFMLIKREVIAKMRKQYPELYYSPKDPRSQTESAFMFFNTELWNGEFWGEDYIFCRNVRGAGFDIWVDPMIEFDHAGVRGSLIEALTTDPSKAQQPVCPS